MKEIQITERMYEELLSQFQYDTQEKGGLLFIQEGQVSGFVLDLATGFDSREYRPNPAFLNQELKKAIQRGAQDFAFLHSHPKGFPLSKGDICWGQEFLRLNGLPSVLLFLLEGRNLTGYECFPYTYQSVSLLVKQSDH